MKYWFCFLACVVLFSIFAWIFEPWNIFIANKHDAIVNEVDSATNWDTLHEVEDLGNVARNGYGTSGKQ